MSTSRLLILPALLVAVLGLAACDSAGPVPYPADAQSGEVALALGASGSLDGLALSFDEVVEDSRCPSDAACVWEGRALVGLTLAGEPVELRVVDPEKAPEAGVRAGGYVVFATRLTAEPVVTVVSFPAD
jgi:hypothetical protein